MSNVNSVGGSANVSTAGLVDLSSFSPDEMLAYCESKLSGLDDQVKSETDRQKLQLQERQAVQKAQTVLEQFGTEGPQTQGEFQQCVEALDKEAKSLPTGDPVARQLEDFKTEMCKQYGFDPSKMLTPGQCQQLDDANKLLHTDGFVAIGAQAQALQTINALGGNFTKPPQNSDWQGTTDALGNMADGIKSDAEIQMLQLQDLVSQRQQAVQLVSGIMSKEDQTLESIAKAIG